MNKNVLMINPYIALAQFRKVNRKRNERRGNEAENGTHEHANMDISPYRTDWLTEYVQQLCIKMQINNKHSTTA